MYLSKAYLNTQNSQVIHNLGDVYELHRTLSTLFPNTTNKKSFRKKFQILYRIEELQDNRPPYLLIQSKTIPEWTKLLDKYPNYFKSTPKSKELKVLLNLLREGQTCIFRLKANPVKRPPPKRFGKGRYQGKTNRIPLQKEEELIKWLERKSITAGFKLKKFQTSNETSVYEVQIRNFPKARITTPYRYQKITGSKKQDILSFHSVLFDGHLQIIDIKEFKDTIINGIGPGKAFGFGLLSVYPLKK